MNTFKVVINTKVNEDDSNIIDIHLEDISLSDDNFENFVATLLVKRLLDGAKDLIDKISKEDLTSLVEEYKELEERAEKSEAEK